MESFLPAFLFALAAVTLAEMGDKTQLLAMAFAAKYKTSKVLLGVFIATVLNHTLAVAFGNLITRFEAIETAIEVLASISFIFFGLWTIKGDKLDGEEKRTTRFGAVATVAIAFFIAEMGDKTQLATVALAAKFPYSPLAILTGTTLGMLLADGLGILAGHALQKKIPERKIKFVSAGVFILFGILGIYQSMRDDFKLNIALTSLIIALTAVLSVLAAAFILRRYDKKT
ncbi:MAG: TMEM165/GDT1 family protein [Deferribacteraceae bacterium]|jgi:putative Ca2+/H+ antiporter (TMEM165/GDT1 family)|nr:TMEM165/GDT1 family protein [Deferribacteraceae bacterium]